MGDIENITIEEAITNQLQMVNFLLQGGNHARAAEGALRAATLYASAGRRSEALTVVHWGLQVDASAYTAEQFTLSLYTVGDCVIGPFRRAALAHLDQGRDEEAWALLAKIVEADPEHPTSRLLLADLYLRKGNDDEAIGHLWAAHDLFDRHGRREGKLEVLHRILDIDPEDAAALWELAQLELRRLDHEAAMRTLTRLLQLRPADRVARELLAEALARGYRSGSSLAILRSVIASYERAGKYDLVRDLTDRAVTWNPEDERFSVMVARMGEPSRMALPAAQQPETEAPKLQPPRDGKTALRVVAS
jgi:tetratricopeptide (TPR) repeat protein